MDANSHDVRTALIVVDVQNDFADPDGSLAVRGGADVVPRINDEIARATGQGALVVYTADWHPASTPHFATGGGIWPDHCVRDTWGAAFHPNLIVEGPVVRKGADGQDGYSGFTTRDPSTGVTQPTELASILREAGVTTVLIVGLATDYCVVATAIDAVAEGFAVSLVTEAVRAVNLEPGDGDRALERMADAGVTLR